MSTNNSKPQVTFKLNGEDLKLEVEPGESLNYTLREKLGLTGTKKGCDTGGCGACTVIVNGKSRYSCMTYTASLSGSTITTIEGLSDVDGRLSRIQEGFIEWGALQCGYCTPGFILSTKALLDRDPRPSGDEIKEALIGNVCRCTGYGKIVQAVKTLSSEIQNPK